MRSFAHAQGLAVYCTVSVVDTDYPCSLSTFSAPGNGRAVTPPVYAPLHAVESRGLSGGEISFGCNLDHDPAAVPPGLGVGDFEDALFSADAAASPTVTESDADVVGSDDAASDALAAAAADADVSDLGYFAAGVLWLRHRLQQRRRRRPKATNPVVSQYGGSVAGYAGGILLVSRGECTFEQKVRTRTKAAIADASALVFVSGILLVLKQYLCV